MDQPVVDQRERQHVADPFDVHRAARAEVPHPLAPLRRAGRVRAARHRLALGMIDGRAADRAVRRQRDTAGGLPLALGEHRTDDLRDDVAGAPHDDDVAVADVLAPDIVFVVQASRCLTVTPPICTGSRSAYGLSVPVRPTLIADVEQPRRRLARAELVGDRPARILAALPSRSCSASSSTLTTTPSIS